MYFSRDLLVLPKHITHIVVRENHIVYIFVLMAKAGHIDDWIEKNDAKALDCTDQQAAMGSFHAFSLPLGSP